MPWLTAIEALAALGVRRQTLYANVSRGRIRAKPDPEDSRRRLYDSGDVKRLAGRRGGRRSVASVAAETIGWGDPILSSSVSTIADGRLIYRGRDAVELAETATLEDIAALLWEFEGLLWESERLQTVRSTRKDRRPHVSDSPLESALFVLAKRVAEDSPSRGRAPAVLKTEAAALVGDLVAAMLEPMARAAPIHQHMAAAWRAGRAEDALRRALVLLADHEFNASTFATRVAISTGAPLSAGLLAGLATLAGPLHGGAVKAAQALIRNARQLGAKAAARDWLAQGRRLPAFGHPLYPRGDPRATALFAHFTPPQIYLQTRAVVEGLIGEEPNIDFAIAALAEAFELPPTASFTIFAIARSVGWIAHALEQAAGGNLIRPRARYTGPAPALTDAVRR
jgi:citrate synthase